MAEATRTRRYRMNERAEAMAETRRRIIEAALEIGDPRTPLERIAAEAAVSTRTILRHFGDRNALFLAVWKEAEARIRAQRFAIDPGDVDAAVARLVDHYEETGDRVIARLAEEGRDERIDRVLEAGRSMHREWVERALGPLLSGLDRTTRRRRRAELVAICDVYTWKLLRRDSGLGREQTERAIAEMIRGIT